MKLSRKITLVLLLSAMTACTEPGETTGIGAATGGVIGAGLGAIVGNQTGDPGAGLVVGAVAGAGAGAAIGNAIEGQEQTIQAQNETLQRQDRTISAQKSEIQELRRMSQDSVNFRGRANLSSSSLTNPSTSQSTYRRIGNQSAAPSAGSQFDRVPHMQPPVASSSKSIVESNLVNPPAGSQPYRGGYRWESGPGATSPAAGGAVAALPPSNGASRSDMTRGDTTHNDTTLNDTAQNETGRQVSATAARECKDADAEVQKASASLETADKLFHYRRALRLCPDNASYHAGLAEVYVTLNRKDDAAFEYNEALRLDPSLETAQSKLRALKTERY